MLHRLSFSCLLLWIAVASYAIGKGKTGIFTIGNPDGKVLVTISKKHIYNDFLLASRVVKSNKEKVGRMRLCSGQRLYNPTWIRFVIKDDSLQMIAPDIKTTVHHATSKEYYKVFCKEKAPVKASFKIIARRGNKLTVDMTSLFVKQVPGVDPLAGKMAPGKMIDKETKIENYYTTPNSLEVSVSFLFQQTNDDYATTLRKNIMMLPERVMTPRLYDNRVGNVYSVQCLSKSEDNKRINGKYMNRFNLEPADKKKYLKGELTEPKKHILFYVDDAFPEEWKEPIKQGILDWNMAFEKIGFKNVIQVKMYSQAGEWFDENAINNNCFRYVKSDFANAMGKNWVDPRSGEIIQADVLFYSNILSLLRKWYFLQTAAYNPLARMKVLPDSVQRRIIRYSAAHEIGHCLGLEHNFRASASYKTENLRNPDFCRKHGTTPSIMDYARFNYVAQPGDGVTDIYPPILGDYDIYAIGVTYKFLKQERQEIVKSWIDEAQKSSNLLYGRASPSVVAHDAHIQTADLGDDPVASAYYGISNLNKIIKDYSIDGMGVSYDDIIDNYFEHLKRVVPYIGGINTVPKGYVSAEESERAVVFLVNQLTQGYKTLKDGAEKVKCLDYKKKIQKEQDTILTNMFNYLIFQHIDSAQAHTGFTASHYKEIIKREFDKAADDEYVLPLKKKCNELLIKKK